MGGPSRDAQVLPAGQDLPAEAQGRQDDVAPILALRSQGAVDPFIHLLGDRLAGRPVSSHRAHGGGHVAGRHQELASSATHGGSWFFGPEARRSSSYLVSSEHGEAKELKSPVTLLPSHGILHNQGEIWRRRYGSDARKRVKVDRNNHPN